MAVNFVSPDWRGIWPATRAEAHYGDRVVTCFAERPGSLHAMLAEAVARNPDGDALVCGGERLTYRALLARTARIAAGLQAHGVQPGDRVALLLGNRIEFVLLLLAATRLGAVTVPLSVREQAPGLAYMLAHSGAVLVVHEPELATLLPAMHEAPALRTRLAVGSADWTALEARGTEPVPATVAEEDCAAILYTSGTTGRPKGAMLTHLGLVHSSMHYQIAMGLGPQDCSVAAVPLSHVTGLVALITTFLRCAGKLVIMPAFKAAEFLPLAARERMTHALMVPAMYNLCLLQPDFAQHHLARWRIGAYGGAPMPQATIESLARTVPSLTLMNVYGATETTSPVTMVPAGCTAQRIATVGTTLACAEVKIVDDAGQELARDTLGEIWIKGPMTVPGYWANPQATAENLSDGWWHSGDLGALDADGYLRVVDRKKDMINRGGYKIYTIEVENALYTHPAVQECAVIARPCPVLGERVHAFVFLRDASVGADALTAHCRPLLSDYKVPESYTLTNAPLPRNANGKLMKRALREQLLAASGARG